MSDDDDKAHDWRCPYTGARLHECVKCGKQLEWTLIGSLFWDTGDPCPGGDDE